jgi:hypothetical protein
MFLSGSVANYLEYMVLQNHGYEFCPWCEVEKKALGRYIDIAVALHNHNVYRSLYKDTCETLYDAEQSLAHMQNPDDTLGVSVHQLAERSSDSNSSTPPVVVPIS